MEKDAHYFEYKHEEFLEHHHKRSNAETTFQMIKSKFGDGVRSEPEVAQVNEVLQLSKTSVRGITCS